MDKQDLMRALCAKVNPRPTIHVGKTENDNNYKFEDGRCVFYVIDNTLVLYDMYTSSEVGIADIADFTIEPNDYGYWIHIVIVPQSGIVAHMRVTLRRMNEVVL
jgi:hypothetical protein